MTKYLTPPEPVKTDEDKWPLRIAVCGKPHSGCEAVCHRMAEKHPLVLLDSDVLLKDSIAAFEEKESVIHQLTKKEATVRVAKRLFNII